MKTNEVDRYIESSADFARPILTHLRELVHRACPDTEEKIKWGFPHFDYKGVYVSMASFKEHCAFNFWKAKEMDDPHGLLAGREEKAMGNFGRIRSLSDLPPDKILLEYLKLAKELNDRGIKRVTTRPSTADKESLEIPADLAAELNRNQAARQHFDAFTYGKKREYILWITEAKTDATREKRISTAVEWIAEGKVRNWKYQ
ncbi:MAG TPA: YdeI/OmpD-associated family protein [Bacteroidales bacterium]|nr:YdeI/OmpD-associated family protein [Bacteroidales bacterium]HPS61435.1 YdeI/OmpD-associated family protein [Bacteroidales bacterium]